MTLDEILTAVRSGRTVHWKNDAYKVTLSIGRRTGEELWHVQCTANNWCLPLLGNGHRLISPESDFYLAL